MIPSYPLSWPTERPRTKRPESTKTTVSLAEARDHLLKQVLQIQVKKVVISSNAVLRQDGLPASKQPKIGDTGVAVWILTKATDNWYCLSCDQYDSIGGNIRAIGLSVAEIRSFSGRMSIRTIAVLEALFRSEPPRKALPAPKSEVIRQPKRTWRQVLQLSNSATFSDALSKWKALTNYWAGHDEKLLELSNAMDEAKKYFNHK